MADDKIVIAQQVLDDILNHASQSWPMECCGLLIAKAVDDGAPEDCARPVLRHVPARNVSPDPTITFEIDPAVLLRTHRTARAQGEDIIGCYHSHPNGLTEPSHTDLARAEQPGFYWLIVGSSAVNTRKWAVYQRMPILSDDAAPRFFRHCHWQVL